MTLCYKLTDSNMQTHAATRWALNEWREASGDPSKPLCTDAWIHVYDSPELAVLLNPIHAEFTSPRLFEAECDGASKDDNGLKRGFRRVRLIRELPLPVFTVEQRIAFGILCAKHVSTKSSFIEWADK